MRLPRDLSGHDLAGALGTFDDEITRQTGRHLRLTTRTAGEHRVTIPAHASLRIGTLAAVLDEVARHLGMSRNALVEKLFGAHRPPSERRRSACPPLRQPSARGGRQRSRSGRALRPRSAGRDGCRRASRGTSRGADRRSEWRPPACRSATPRDAGQGRGPGPGAPFLEISSYYPIRCPDERSSVASGSFDMVVFFHCCSRSSFAACSRNSGAAHLCTSKSFLM